LIEEGRGDDMAELLSLEALAWLQGQGYAEADHERRMDLIREAKELFGEE